MKISSMLAVMITCVIITVLQFSCSQQPPDFTSFPKIDAHFHIHTLGQAVIDQARTDNFMLLSPNTRASNQAFIDEQFRLTVGQHKKNPDIVAFASTFSMQDWGQPGWQDKAIAYLQASFDSGAVAVKVWKDIGMTFRDADSSFIMIDNPTFDPIFAFIASQNKTVLAHQGEPLNCWLPLDSMTVNGDKSYFKNNPQYHMFLHPDYPTHAQLMAARDNWLAKNPNLRVVGAHLGSLEWDVDVLAKTLDKYPNLAVDMSARICHLQVQNHDKVRDFIITYQDRLLYGTDLGVSDNDDPKKIKADVHNTWLEDWRYFTTDDTMSTWNVETPFQGLKLDKTVLQKIYHDNALRWYPGLQLKE